MLEVPARRFAMAPEPLPAVWPKWAAPLVVLPVPIVPPIGSLARTFDEP